MKFAPDWLLPGGSREAYLELISSTGGSGRQSSKWGYVLVVQWGTICASIQTLAGALGFAFKQAGDAASWGTYWGANFALWSALFTAVAVTKVKQANAAKEIRLAGMPNAPPPPGPPTVTKKNTVTETKVTSKESSAVVDETL